MLITKREEVTKQNTLKKTPSSGKSVIRIYSLKWVRSGWALIWVWFGGGGGGRLFEAGRLLTFSAFRMGAYSRWALIRGRALIRINTVTCFCMRAKRSVCYLALAQASTFYFFSVAIDGKALLSINFLGLFSMLCLRGMRTLNTWSVRLRTD